MRKPLERSLAINRERREHKKNEFLTSRDAVLLETHGTRFES